MLRIENNAAELKYHAGSGACDSKPLHKPPLPDFV
jgi:hypothetical protein